MTDLTIRERLRGDGPGRLTDVDLVALVLGSGHAGASVITVADRLVADAGGIAALAEREPSELQKRPGVGPALAARLAAAFELGRRVARQTLGAGALVGASRDAALHFHGLIGDRNREEFHELLLDTRHRVLGHRVVSVGSLQSSIVHPREVFRPAVRAAAAAVVVAHNHPSGDPSPSPEDRAVTARLTAAGELMGIALLDHIVLGEQEFYSFAEDQRHSL